MTTSNTTEANKKLVIAAIKGVFVDGKVAEHWDVLQEEVPAAKTANGNDMFPGAA